MELLPVALVGSGAVVLATSIAAVRHEEIPSWEQRVFHAVNGLPGALHPPLWVLMQPGNLVVGVGAGMALAWWRRDLAVAVAVVVGAGLKLAAERVLRARTEPYLAVRKRPGTSVPGAVLRGRDVPVSGPSFPSGHALLAAVLGCIAAAVLPLAWVWLPVAVMVAVSVGRVYVGAHNPLDVSAGLGAGLLVGGGLALVLV